MIATYITPKSTGLEHFLMRFMLPNFGIKIEEGLLFQNIPKPENPPCRPRSHILRLCIKLSYSTFVGFVMQGHKM